VSDLDELGAAKYVLLTTFRKDGRGVGTPVWLAREGDELFVWTGASTGKVRRIRNNGAVMLAPCSFRGQPSGSAVAGHASLLDAAGSARALALIQRKYGLVGWLTILNSRVRSRISRGSAGTLCIRISLA
jgi:PPOX class probable F420-dependent enzyme